MRISDWSSDVCSSDLRIDSAKTVLYAGIDADLTPELTAYLHGGYERYRRTSFDGIPTLPDGSPAPVGRSFFIGSGDFDLVTPVARVNGGLDWEASSALSVSLRVNYLRSNTTGESGFGFDLQPNGDFRSEEHTSELQSLMRISYAVFCLKKNKH